MLGPSQWPPYHHSGTCVSSLMRALFCNRTYLSARPRANLFNNIINKYKIQTNVCNARGSRCPSFGAHFDGNKWSARVRMLSATRARVPIKMAKNAINLSTQTHTAVWFNCLRVQPVIMGREESLMTARVYSLCNARACSHARPLIYACASGEYNA